MNKKHQITSEMIMPWADNKKKWQGWEDVYPNPNGTICRGAMGDTKNIIPLSICACSIKWKKNWRHNGVFVC